MAKIAGKDSGIYIKHYDISGDGNRVALTISPDTFETTGFQEKAKTYVEGKYDWSLAVDGYWNSGSAQSDQAIKELVGAGTQLISVFPSGTTPTMIGYQGYGGLKNYSPETTVAGAVVFSADMQGSNKLYRQTILLSGFDISTINGPYINMGTLNPGVTIQWGFLSLPNSRGTVSAILQASTSSVGAGIIGLVSGFNLVDTGVQVLTIGTAVNVGPYWKATASIPATDSFKVISALQINA